MVEKKIDRNTKLVLESSSKDTIPRDAAMDIAVNRVLKECKICSVDYKKQRHNH